MISPGPGDDGAGGTMIVGCGASGSLFGGGGPGRGDGEGAGGSSNISTGAGRSPRGTGGARLSVSGIGVTAGAVFFLLIQSQKLCFGGSPLAARAASSFFRWASTQSARSSQSQIDGFFSGILPDPKWPKGVTPIWGLGVFRSATCSGPKSIHSPLSRIPRYQPGCGTSVTSAQRPSGTRSERNMSSARSPGWRPSRYSTGGASNPG